MSRTRRRFTAKEKVIALKRHLVEGQPVSAICDELRIQPSHFYTWQKQFFEQGEAIFANGDRRSAKRARDAAGARIAALEAKLQRKDEVLAELMEEHVALKKSLGEA
jgi:transposase